MATPWPEMTSRNLQLNSVPPELSLTVSTCQFFVAMTKIPKNNKEEVVVWVTVSEDQSMVGQFHSFGSKVRQNIAAEGCGGAALLHSCGSGSAGRKRRRGRREDAPSLGTPPMTHPLQLGATCLQGVPS